MRLTILLCACLLGVAVAAAAAAQPTYPKGPVRMIVPFPAGGGVDAAGRVLAQALSASVGKPFVIENRGGANGNIGTELAARASADGYTLLFTGAGLVTNPSLYKKVPYDPVKDFEPVSLMALGPNILVVHPSLSVRSVSELIAAAKARPGEIGFAGAGGGSTPHLAGELFNTMAGVQMVHVPYRGSGPAMIGLLAGDAPVMFLPAINAGPHIAAGKVRALGVTSRERLARAGHEGPHGARRPRRNRQHTRRVRRAPQGRGREMGARDPRLRRERRLKPQEDQCSTRMRSAAG